MEKNDLKKKFKGVILFMMTFILLGEYTVHKCFVRVQTKTKRTYFILGVNPTRSTLKST